MNTDPLIHEEMKVRGTLSIHEKPDNLGAAEELIHAVVDSAIAVNSPQEIFEDS